MSSIALSSVVHGLGQLQRRHDTIRITDGEWLEHFIHRKDSEAFAWLVRLHGPMVLGVCRRILRNESDAEDAFQATFLVLIRKAASITPRNMVGNWLYGVACTTALKARAMNTKRTAKEQKAEPRQQYDHQSNEELQVILDQELQTLPAIYRTAIVLCDLEGKSIKQAAQQLGCPAGTLGARLVRGRSLLARRLKSRQVTLSSAGLVAHMTQAAADAGVPPLLMHSTVQAAASLTAGQASVEAIFSAKVLSLSNGVMKAMLLSKLKLVVVAVGVVLLGAATLWGGAGEPGSTIGESTVAGVSMKKSLIQPQPPKPVKAANFIWAVAYIPDGKSLVVSEGENLVRLWDMTTHLPGKSFIGAKKIIRSVAVSSDGKLLAAGGDEGIIFVWEVATQKLLYQHDAKAGGILSVVFSPSGETFASAHHTSDKTSTVYLYPSKTDQKILSISLKDGTVPFGAGTGLAFKPDGTELAVIQHGHFTGICVIDLTTVKDMSSETLSKDLANMKSIKKISYESGFIPESIAYSPDGLKIATGGTAPPLPNPNDARFFGMPRGHVKIWDAKKGDLLETLFDGSDGNVKALIFAKNQNRLYVGTTTKMGEPFQTKDGLVGRLGGSYQCWDTNNSKLLWEAQTRGGLTFGMGLSRDDKQLAVANSAGCWILTSASGKSPVQLAETPETPPGK